MEVKTTGSIRPGPEVCLSLPPLEDECQYYGHGCLKRLFINF